MFDYTVQTTTISTAFLASLVEVVEAFTIVLAVGLTRSWKPAIIGVITALGTLAGLILILGNLIVQIPFQGMQFFIGTLLILFGLRWLRKAILRYAGIIPLHDETAVYERATTGLQAQTSARDADWIAGLTAFKAVVLEGVEVVFIVIAIGSAHGQIYQASLGALAACLLVLIVGFFVHKPLSRVPENDLKYVVGLMITAFGIFWTAQGMGAHWPGEDLALLGIFAILFVWSNILIKHAKRGQVQ